MTHFHLFRKSVFLAAIASLACLAFADAAIRTSHSSGDVFSQTPVNPQLKIRTAAPNLQIKELRLTGNKLEMALKNDYGDSITAFIISVAGEEYAEDLIFAESPAARKLAPSAIRQLRYILPSSASQPPEIVVYGVVFDNLKYVGDPQRVVKVFLRRSGLRKQIARIYPYLSKLGEASDEAGPVALEQLKSAAELLSTKEAKGQSKHVGEGLQSGKDIVDEWISDLDKFIQTGNIQQMRAKYALIRERCIYLLNRM
ncbi:MAG TPA: hypothetical protein VNQ79_22715 [Blastocatellia bacterium]|nr:hypothetical protein [Blastocatellia bacterium]